MIGGTALGALDVSMLRTMPRKSKLPTRLQPMLATLTDGPFDDPDWIFESKWDGFRMVASIERGPEMSAWARKLPQACCASTDRFRMPSRPDSSPLSRRSCVLSFHRHDGQFRTATGIANQKPRRGQGRCTDQRLAAQQTRRKPRRTSSSAIAILFVCRVAVAGVDKRPTALRSLSGAGPGTCAQCLHLLEPLRHIAHDGAHADHGAVLAPERDDREFYG